MTIEIRVPTLVMAGHDDFLFPPESQALLAAGLPDARLRIIERAGHNPQTERPAETLAAVAGFLAVAPAPAKSAGRHPNVPAGTPSMILMTPSRSILRGQWRHRRIRQIRRHPSSR